jgi:hypothetical protein
MKNVYHIENDFHKFSDGRVDPTFKTAQVILPVLFAFLLGIKSFLDNLKRIYNFEVKRRCICF